MKRNQGLKVEIKEGRLIISVGLDIISFAYQEKTGHEVIDRDGFAQDVLLALQKEDETGETITAQFLDSAASKAADLGSENVVFQRLQHVKEALEWT